MKLKKILAVVVAGVSILTGCAASNEIKTEEVKGEKVQVNQESSEVQEVEELNVVSITVAATQVLDKLGVDLVGVPTTKSTLPTRYEGVTQVGQVLNPDFEIVASLDADLVIIDSMFKEDVEESMKAYGMNAFYFNTSTYTSFLESIDELGEAVGRKEEALELVKELKSVEEKIKNKMSGEAPTVAILFGGGENFMLATDKSYLGDLVHTVGAHNITDDLAIDSDYISFSMEQIIASNPDFILRFAHGNLEETKKAFDQAFEKNPAFATLDAVKEGRVIDLDPGVFGVSANIHVVNAIQTLGEIFYGE